MPYRLGRRGPASAIAIELEGVIEQVDFNDQSKLGTGREMHPRRG